MADETALIRASIVLVGKFNPAIFSPAWFSKNDLLSDEELQVVETGVVHPEFTQFRMEHLFVEVKKDRFLIQMDSDPFLRLLDMTTAIFGTLLPHSPVEAVGMNYHEHFKLNSWERRVALGRALAPIGPWGEWGKTLESGNPEMTGGLIQLVMKQQYADESKGFRRVDIQPSNEIPDQNIGVAMLINDHRPCIADGDEDCEAIGATMAIDVLNAEFEKSLDESKKIVSDILEFAKGLDV